MLALLIHYFARLLARDWRRAEMTDLETVEAMLARAKIGYRKLSPIDGHTDARGEPDDEVWLVIDEADSDHAYLGFYAIMYFNLDGSLKEIGAYE